MDPAFPTRKRAKSQTRPPSPKPPQTSHLPLLGKTAVVTGGSRGIGAGIAYELAKKGADVVITYTSASSQKMVWDLEQKISLLPHQPKTLGARADLSSLDGAKEILLFIKSWRSPNAIKIDILVNNAGIEKIKPLGEITASDYEALYNLNVRGALLMTQEVLPYLGPGSRIINISSVGARAGFAGLSLYCSSKAALEGLTRCWAAELGKNGTTVNAVNPGPVESEMLDKIPKDLVEMQMKNTPIQNRVGKVEDVAPIVAWLASEESRWVTGQVISASGGWAMY
ncbi:putative 3-ketoacyl-acyl carrier protein reductase protein [Coleophoma cylindrospora]|uniref:Putative 3-ketoacyl-acyl carrier protein reductase protein n=1 Tax=Coleophoma cylindrospora TaxID=1849047 RepID=A0A3D8S1V1_9HELO|nr:putative 3-ketoacyl-acyl carrier protein reductase protein [Coleophoma cylindrospora]